MMNIILAGIAGATLSARDFFLDYLGDYQKDRDSGNMKNPIARGSLSPRGGVIFIISWFLIISKNNKPLNYLLNCLKSNLCMYYLDILIWI